MHVTIHASIKDQTIATAAASVLLPLKHHAAIHMKQQSLNLILDRGPVPMNERQASWHPILIVQIIFPKEVKQAYLLLIYSLIEELPRDCSIGRKTHRVTQHHLGRKIM